MTDLAAPPTEARSSLRFAVSPMRGISVRDATGTGDGSWTMEGYSAVYDQETTLYDIAGFVRVDEEIARGAFTDVLQRLAHGDGLIHLNHGHDMKTAMAATDVSGIGSLELSEDFHGERFFARVDPEDPDARSLAVKMSRGIVRQSSFAFTIGEEELVDSRELDDGTWLYKFRILKIQDQFDVCVCAQGAYPQTESYLRSLAAASLRVPDLGTLGRSGFDPEGFQRRLERAGASDIAPVIPAGGGDSQRSVELLRLKAHAAAAKRNLIEETQ